ncbi:MAG TPA: cupin domain-containing protein [Clostridia bacterium]|nr:cupin domain-containing protein [Clostridia bacterium]
MIIRAENVKKEVRKQMRGGLGEAHFSHLLADGDKPAKCRLFSLITLESGSSIGTHMHENETEIFHMLEGTAEYNDNGVSSTVSAGDTTVTKPNESHGIANNGPDKLVFMAVIIKE